MMPLSLSLYGVNLMLIPGMKFFDRMEIFILTRAALLHGYIMNILVQKLIKGDM